MSDWKNAASDEEDGNCLIQPKGCANSNQPDREGRKQSQAIERGLNAVGNVPGSAGFYLGHRNSFSRLLLNRVGRRAAGGQPAVRYIREEGWVSQTPPLQAHGKGCLQYAEPIFHASLKIDGRSFFKIVGRA